MGSPVANGGYGFVQGITLSLPREAQFLHRSVYLPILRGQLPESLAVFDAPDPSLISGERATTTVPAQGLYLLNSPIVLRASGAAAEKLLESAPDDGERGRQAYLRFFGRLPSDREQEAAPADVD